MGTRLDAFLRKQGIGTSEVANATRYHRNHIARIRKGSTEPTRECMAAILQFVRTRTKRQVEIDDLFVFALPRKKAVGQ